MIGTFGESTLSNYKRLEDLGNVDIRKGKGA